MKSDCPEDSDNEPVYNRSQSDKVSEIKVVMKNLSILTKYNFEKKNKMAQKSFTKPKGSSRASKRNLPRDATLLKKMMDKFFEKENFEEEDPLEAYMCSIKDQYVPQEMASQSMYNSIQKQMGKDGERLQGLNGLVLGDEDEMDESKMITFDQIVNHNQVI